MGGRKPNSKYDYSRLEARQMLSANLPDTDAQVELAKQYLASQPETAYLLEGQSDVQLVQLKHGLASTTTRFQQTMYGLPVHNGLITINQGPDGQFQRVHHELAFTPQEANFPQRQDDQVEVTFGQAEIAAMDFAGIDKIDLESRGELSWFVQQDGDAVLAWDIAVFNLTDSVGDYYTVVDAASGSVLFQENRAKFYTTGSGFSYEPNPYQTAGNGAGLVDNNDATSPELDAQRINVILEGLNEDTGLLIGEFVDLATLNSPTIEDNDADEPSRIYEYDRDDPRFEQVVVYSSVDQINRYFHSLGFDDDSGTPNGIRDFPTLANAHWFEADNSFYSTGNDAIHFGDGGVDDAEDADIVAHEYGHAVQLNQNTFYFGGDTGAMGEGFSDYLGAIFYRDSGDTQFLSEHSAAVGEWDATSYSSDNPPNLRRVDGNKMYPRDLVGQVHADGEIWSRALWDLAKHVGADYANQIILEHHFTLEAAATMPTAANAIIAANQNINGGDNAMAIRHGFTTRGILPAVAGVELNQEFYDAGDLIEVIASDAAMVNGDFFVQISTSDGDLETLRLTDDLGTRLMHGSIETVQGSVVQGDGFINIFSPTTTVTATFIGNSGLATDSATVEANIAAGTDGDDIIIVRLGDTVSVDVNGEITEFGRAATGSFAIDARGGYDQITVYDSELNDTTEIRDGVVSVNGVFLFQGNNVEQVLVISGGGEDSISLFGTSGDEVFEASPDGVSLTGDGFIYETMGQMHNRGFAMGGNDAAFFQDSTGNDNLYASPVFTNLRLEDGTTFNARDFDRVGVHSTAGGDDFGAIIGTDLADNLFANLNFASLTAANGIAINLIDFERTWTDGRGGLDSVAFLGSAQQEFFNSSPTSSFMYATGSYFHQVAGFENINAFSNGGNDQAILRDSPGTDNFYASPSIAALTSVNHSAIVNGFPEVYAYGSAGFDSATLVDSAGDDTYTARPHAAFLQGNGYLNWADSFNSVTAISSMGNDRAVFFGSDQDDRFFGSLGTTWLRGSTFLNWASNFSNITVVMNQGGFDIGTFQDSEHDDVFIAENRAAILYSNNYFIYVTDLDRAFAISDDGGDDDAAIAPNEFEIFLSGGWI